MGPTSKGERKRREKIEEGREGMEREGKCRVPPPTLE